MVSTAEPPGGPSEYHIHKELRRGAFGRVSRHRHNHRPHRGAQDLDPLLTATRAASSASAARSAVQCTWQVSGCEFLRGVVTPEIGTYSAELVRG